jgi:hypothetical protein
MKTPYPLEVLACFLAFWRLGVVERLAIVHA